jgi:hypothetical protein
MGTGTVMFDLKKSGDRAVLFGESEFEFRLETKEISEGAYGNMIGKELEEIVSEYY